MVSAAAQQLPEEVYRPEGKRAPKAPEEQSREDRHNKRRAHKVADKKRTAQQQVCILSASCPPLIVTMKNDLSADQGGAGLLI